MGKIHRFASQVVGRQLRSALNGGLSKSVRAKDVRQLALWNPNIMPITRFNDDINSIRSFSSQSSKNEKAEEEGKEQNNEKPKAGPGFFATFRKSFLDQFSRKSEEDDKVKVAMEQLQKARTEAGEAARKSMDIAQKAAEEARKQAEKVEEQTRGTREKIGGVVGGIAKKVADSSIVQGTAELGMRAAETILDVPNVIDKQSKNVEQKINQSAVAQKVREALGDDAPQLGPVPGKPIDTETMGIAVRPESRWERTMRKLRDTALLGPLVVGTEEAYASIKEVSNRIGDRIFETEMSVSLSEIKREEPTFNIHRLLHRLQEKDIPLVLKCSLENRIADIEHLCTERMVSFFGAEVQVRMQKGHVVDSTVMDVDDVELEKAIIWDGEPFLVISFTTQQVHCVKDKAGKVIVGGDSELRQIRYRWVMARMPPKDGVGLPQWRLHEMAKFYETPLIA